MSPDELDERHFIHRDARNFTPFKMSPFARTSNMHKQLLPIECPFLSKQPVGDSDLLEPPHKRQLQSSRMLNYD